MQGHWLWRQSSTADLAYHFGRCAALKLHSKFPEVICDIPLRLNHSLRKHACMPLAQALTDNGLSAYTVGCAALLAEQRLHLSMDNRQPPDCLIVAIPQLAIHRRLGNHLTQCLRHVALIPVRATCARVSSIKAARLAR